MWYSSKKRPEKTRLKFVSGHKHNIIVCRLVFLDKDVFDYACIG